MNNKQRILSINIQEIEPIDILFEKNLSSNINKVKEKILGYVNNIENETNLKNKLNKYSINGLNNNKDQFVIVNEDQYNNVQNSYTYKDESSAIINITDIIKNVININGITFITIYVCHHLLKKKLSKSMYSKIQKSFKALNISINFTFAKPSMLEPKLRYNSLIHYVKLLNVVKKIVDISEYTLLNELNDKVYSVTIKKKIMKLNSYGTDIQLSTQYKLVKSDNTVDIGTLKPLNKVTGRYTFINKTTKILDKEVMLYINFLGIMMFTDPKSKETGMVIQENKSLFGTNLSTHNFERTNNSLDTFYVPKHYDLSKYKSTNSIKSLKLFTNINLLNETFYLLDTSINIDPIKNIHAMLKLILKNGNNFYIQELTKDIVKGYDYFKYEVVGIIPDATLVNNTTNNTRYTVNEIKFKLYTSPKKGNKCSHTKKNISFYISQLMTKKLI